MIPCIERQATKSKHFIRLVRNTPNESVLVKPGNDQCCRCSALNERALTRIIITTELKAVSREN